MTSLTLTCQYKKCISPTWKGTLWCFNCHSVIWTKFGGSPPRHKVKEPSKLDSVNSLTVPEQDLIDPRSEFPRHPLFTKDMSGTQNDNEQSLPETEDLPDVRWKRVNSTDCKVGIYVAVHPQSRPTLANAITDLVISYVGKAPRYLVRFVRRIFKRSSDNHS
jgi:hypothetical protein